MVVSYFNTLCPSRSHYEAGGASFDGSNDYLRLDGTPFPDGTDNINISFWFKKTGESGDEYFIDTTGGAIKVWIDNSANSLQVEVTGTSIVSTNLITGVTSAATATLSVASFNNYENNKWHHFCMSLALTSLTNTVDVYLNDEVVASSGLTKTSSIPSNPSSYYIGADNGGGNRMDVELSEFFITDFESINFTTKAKRRNFISPSKRPVYLGSDGILGLSDDSVVTPQVPQVYLRGSGGGFSTNFGSLGNFSTVGSLSTPPTSPSKP